MQTEPLESSKSQVPGTHRRDNFIEVAIHGRSSTMTCVVSEYCSQVDPGYQVPRSFATECYTLAIYTLAGADAQSEVGEYTDMVLEQFDACAASQYFK